MSNRIHRMPRRLFEALAAGGGGVEAIRELSAAQFSRHVILLRGVVEAAKVAGTEQAQLSSRGYALLAAAQQRDRAAADAVIRYPSVGAWALRAVRAFRSDPPEPRDVPLEPAAEPSMLCSVAAAAAIRAGLASEIDVPVIDGMVVLPSLGVAAVSAENAVVRTAPGVTDIEWAGGRIELSPDAQPSALGWSAIRHIKAGTLELSVDDVDPFRMPAAPYLAPRLSNVEVHAWGETFRRAWQLLDRHHPLIRGEAEAAISVIVPLIAPSSGRVSSSSPETFGGIALSEPSDPCTLAVTIAHELQHIKLSALLDIVPLTLPDGGRRFYAPWRDDPRPISGLLQGAYAFLGVSDFWCRQRHLESGEAGLRANAEFARWRSAAAQVVATLRSSGQLTQAGLDFMHGMAATLQAWQDDPVPENARALARHEAEQHLATWQSAHGSA
jgi:HEXXH motif-containing protein